MQDTEENIKEQDKFKKRIEIGTIIALVIFIVVVIIGITIIHVQIDNVIKESSMTTK